MKLSIINNKNGLLVALVVLSTSPSLATETLPPASVPNIFTTGDVIRASDMNDNFSAVIDAVNNVELTPGAQGIPGATGTRGPTGAKGLIGATGAPGITGPAGADGVQGPTGAAGADGAQGPAGIAGVDGVDGADGAVGMNWQGDWIAGTSYVAGDAVAYAGGSYIAIQDSSGVENPDDISYWEVLAERGTDGVDGEQGIAGAQGPTGFPGATGAQGDVGPIGLTGSTGAQGSIGAPGPAGPQGPAGIQGIQGDVGPIGLSGATGPTGPQGAAGADGATGPVGLQGDPGLAGGDGATGPAGPQGVQGIAGNDGVDAGPIIFYRNDVEQAFDLQPNQTAGGSAQCASGDQMTGGGCRINYIGMSLYENGPVSTSQWNCAARCDVAYNGVNCGGILRSYVFCANLP